MSAKMKKTFSSPKFVSSISDSSQNPINGYIKDETTCTRLLAWLPGRALRAYSKTIRAYSQDQVYSKIRVGHGANYAPVCHPFKQKHQLFVASNSHSFPYVLWWLSEVLMQNKYICAFCGEMSDFAQFAKRWHHWNTLVDKASSNFHHFWTNRHSGMGRPPSERAVWVDLMIYFSIPEVRPFYYFGWKNEFF